jgi:hypothetical protein
MSQMPRIDQCLRGSRENHGSATLTPAGAAACRRTLMIPAGGCPNRRRRRPNHSGTDGDIRRRGQHKQLAKVATLAGRAWGSPHRWRRRPNHRLERTATSNDHGNLTLVGSTPAFSPRLDLVSLRPTGRWRRTRRGAGPARTPVPSRRHARAQINWDCRVLLPRYAQMPRVLRIPGVLRSVLARRCHAPQVTRGTGIC